MHLPTRKGTHRRTRTGRPSRALARAYRNAPTQATRQELTVLEGLGR